MYFLDSSAIIELFKSTEKGIAIEKEIMNNMITTSVINVHELLIGATEKELPSVSEFFNSHIIVEFDKESAFRSAMIYKELKKQGEMINKFDILIASICQTNNFTMLTCDSDFKKIKGLKINLIK